MPGSSHTGAVGLFRRAQARGWLLGRRADCVDGELLRLGAHGCAGRASGGRGAKSGSTRRWALVRGAGGVLGPARGRAASWGAQLLGRRARWKQRSLGRRDGEVAIVEDGSRRSVGGAWIGAWDEAGSLTRAEMRRRLSPSSAAKCSTTTACLGDSGSCSLGGQRVCGCDATRRGGDAEQRAHVADTLPAGPGRCENGHSPSDRGCFMGESPNGSATRV